MTATMTTPGWKKKKKPMTTLLLIMPLKIIIIIIMPLSVKKIFIKRSQNPWLITVSAWSQACVWKLLLN